MARPHPMRTHRRTSAIPSTGAASHRGSWTRLTLQHVTLAALCLICAGCLPPDPFSADALRNLDTRTEPDGRVLVLDSRANWRFFSSAIGAQVEQEAKGLPPPGNIGSWTAYWRLGISKLRTGQEHPEKYFALVLDLRRRYELPDLPREAIER